MSHQTSGYIACSLLLTENHELTIMLVNTLQRVRTFFLLPRYVKISLDTIPQLYNSFHTQDLKSTYYLDVCAALNALCHISHTEMVGAVLESVAALLDYPKYIC